MPRAQLTDPLWVCPKGCGHKTKQPPIVTSVGHWCKKTNSHVEMKKETSK